MEEPEKTRIDKWLWAVRIYKTRSLAAEACAAGKVKVDGENAKASLVIKPGKSVIVNKEGLRHTFRVLKIIEKRVGAPLAVQCYEDLTPPEEKDKLRFPASFYEVRDRGAGRPTKKERREIDKFKGDES